MSNEIIDFKTLSKLFELEGWVRRLIDKPKKPDVFLKQTYSMLLSVKNRKTEFERA